MTRCFPHVLAACGALVACGSTVPDGAHPGTPARVALERSVCPVRFQAIPAGSFLAGSPDGEGYDAEHPQHRVTLSPFLLSATEVTVCQWNGVFDLEPAQGRRDYPVEQVSWCDALRFANALSTREGLPPVYEITDGCERSGDVTMDPQPAGFRLPTEAEWEYAVRAGTSTRYWSGDSADLAGVGWVMETSNLGTHPTASVPPNPWGLSDMHGNVFEWVWDRYGPYGPDPMVDPTGPTTGRDRGFRGGSAQQVADLARSAFRYGRKPDSRVAGQGFRLALSTGKDR